MIIGIVAGDDSIAEAVATEAECRGHETRHFPEMLEALREAAQLVFIEWSGSGSYEELTRGLRVASQANPPVPVVILSLIHI